MIAANDGNNCPAGRKPLDAAQGPQAETVHASRKRSREPDA